MFRRRANRRLSRPLRRMARAGLRAPQELILANQMMESGNFAGAAEQLETLIRLQETRGGLPVPHLYLQAGRACFLSGHDKAGLAHLKQGLSLLAARGEWLRFHRAGWRTVNELHQRGLSKEAGEISEFLNSKLPENFSVPMDALPARKATLPTHCPSCGAAIKPDEVDWLDELTAECAYCGSPVREEI